jgi:hypothetical protein
MATPIYEYTSLEGGDNSMNREFWTLWRAILLGTCLGAVFGLAKVRDLWGHENEFFILGQVTIYVYVGAIMGGLLRNAWYL